jgi:hypothetical protein
MDLSLSELNLKISIPVTLVVWYLIQSYTSYRRLAHVPGPWLAAWSSLWLVGTVWRKRAHIEFYDVAKQYGDSPSCYAFQAIYLVTHLRFSRKNRTQRSHHV